MRAPIFSAFFSNLMVSGLIALAAVPGAGHVVQAIRDYDGTDPAGLPKTLSATGFYADAAVKSKKPTEGIKAYEVNVALWSDGAAKQRYVDLPAGAKIVPTDSDQYVIPDKTVFIKNFAIDTVYGDSATRILIETRFLVVRKDPARAEKLYRGFTYQWRRNQSDADLVDPAASLDTVHLIRLNGKIVGKRWTYPSGTDCNQCHKGRGTLGFITPQLNRPDSANPSVNQLKALFTAGVLSVDVYRPALHRWIGLKEKGAAATAEAKARAYLAANCSHCHGNKVSLEGADHDFDYFSPAREIRFPQSAKGFVGKPTGKEPGFPQIIHPGFPESSYVVFRMQSRGDLSYRGLAQMPPLATFQPDSGAIAVMRDWICSMGVKPGKCTLPVVQDDGSYWEPVAGIHHRPLHAKNVTQERPIIRDGFLRLPSGISPKDGLRLFSTEGRAIPLSPIDDRRLMVPPGLGNGLYILIAGKRSIIIAKGMK